MRLPTPSWKKQTDEEYIAKLRRSMAFWDRWRHWMIVLQITLLAAVTWFMLSVVEVLLKLGGDFGERPIFMGLIIGGIFGISMGWMFYGLIHSLVFAMQGHRTEKLLLKHYDAKAVSVEATTQSTANESEMERFLRENRAR